MPSGIPFFMAYAQSHKHLPLETLCCGSRHAACRFAEKRGVSPGSDRSAWCAASRSAFSKTKRSCARGAQKSEPSVCGWFLRIWRTGGARAAMRAAEKPPLQSGAALIACQSNAADRIRKSRRNSIPSGFEEEKKDFLRSPCIFWWSWGELNSRPLECHSSALPTELQPLGQVRILPQTSHVVNSRMRCCGTFRLSCRGQACTSRYTLSVFHPSAYPPFGCRRKKAA